MIGGRVRAGRASKTAEHNALFRALEARRPEPERIVHDPMADRFLSLAYQALAELARIRWTRAVVCRGIDRRWPGVRTSVIARTRLIDETIVGIVATTSQVVVLGAGYDTRAWRLPCLQGVDVYEVDHPDTQRHKRARLGDAAGGVHTVRFVASDFHLGRLDASMSAVGFDPATPTLFLWEGTTNYLSADAVDETMRWVARAAPGSHLLFTYVDRALFDRPGDYVGADRVLSTLRRVGEQIRFGLAPEETATYLARRGFDLVSDEGAADYRARAYGSAARTMHGHEFYRVAHACVRAANV